MTGAPRNGRYRRNPTSACVSGEGRESTCGYSHADTPFLKLSAGHPHTCLTLPSPSASFQTQSK
jgi:hypothetical protein